MIGTERAQCVLAPNPVTDDPRRHQHLDPARARSRPVDRRRPRARTEEHLRGSGRRPGRVAPILLTHGHSDHAEGAGRFAELAGSVPVRALDPALRLGGEGLAEGDVLAVGGLELRVMETPGHTPDSLCFWLPADGCVLTGDTVLGYGTTVLHIWGTIWSHSSGCGR